MRVLCRTGAGARILGTPNAGTPYGEMAGMAGDAYATELGA